jgi:hypothetical protein
MKPVFVLIQSQSSKDLSMQQTAVEVTPAPEEEEEEEEEVLPVSFFASLHLMCMNLFSYSVRLFLV